MFKSVRWFICFSLCASLAFAQQVSGKKATQAKTAPGSQPKFKAIWEPVNVKEDLELMSVHFATPEEGWVAGGRNLMNGGVILYTKDAGATWETQLGDPQSSDRAYYQFRFLGPTLGIAAQSSPGDHKLLRTNDGRSWAPVGAIKEHRVDYRFISADVGFYTYHNQIFRTQDAGRRWEPVYTCRVKAEVNGLTRDVDCQLQRLYFVNSQVGFSISRELGKDAGLVLARTDDAGTTWQPAVILPGETGYEAAVHFSESGIGRLRAKSGRFFHSPDGGKTWNGASGQIGGNPNMQFADDQVGWTMVYNTMAYTVDGGRNWVSRTIPFPAQVTGFSLVNRTSGYAIGNHGMVYRYRVVPIEYTAKGMLAAPAMPAK